MNYKLDTKDAQEHYELCHNVSKYFMKQYPKLFEDMLIKGVE